MHHNHDPEPIPEGSRYEKRDLKAVPIWKAITWFFLVTTVTILVCVPILNGLSWAHTEVTGAPGFKDGRELDLPPASAPLLQNNVTNRVDTFKLGREAREKTETYGWVDETTGRAHVPVAKAIEEVAGSGKLPTFAKTPAPETTEQPVDASTAPTTTPTEPDGAQSTT